jgi:hypothetical protein
MTRTQHYLNALLLIFIALFICNVAYAAIYQIVNTKEFVNGVPPSLTVKERAKLVEMKTQAQTESACIGSDCKLLDKARAKSRIKSIIASEVCPANTTGTWPNCVPVIVVPPKPVCSEYQTYNPATNKCDAIPCDAGFTGYKPVCIPVPPPTSSLMPYVDKTKEVVPAVGYSTLRVKNTNEQLGTSSEGAFRISCAISHMSNDDPMVFPNQKGATHHHSFYGNTSIKYDSDLSNLSSVGNSTCNGGTMNKSGYWHPTMINSVNGAPVLPDQGAIFYYKVGGVVASSIEAPPKGLRMLAGNPKATNANEAYSTKFVCINIALQHSNGMAWQKTIPNCGTESFLQMVVEFPQCWNGKDLDSPNHQDHMARPNGQTANRCPASHPVAFPLISLNLNYKVPAGGTGKWRLASDNYAYTGNNAGYSGHADWVNGWSDGFLEGIVKNVLNPGKDAHAHLLGDGRMFE